MQASRSAVLLCVIAVSMTAVMLCTTAAVAYEAQAEPWVIAAVEQSPGMPPPPAPPDETAPETSISHAVVPVGKHFAKFFFESTEPESTFQCKFDQFDSLECGSPQRYGHLGDGGHVIRVYAVDTSGNVDPTPAIVHFRIVRPTPRATTAS
jgi:hypothetical protein